MMKLQATTLMLIASAFTTVLGQVSFSEKNFEEVIAQAKNESKYVMVDAYTDWCSWCKVMDKETFSEPVVGDFINPKLVSTKINMEEGFGIDLAMKYRVASYPQYLFFDGEGQLIGRLEGFIKPEPFMKAVGDQLDTSGFLPPTSDPMNFSAGYPEFLRNSYKKNKERTNPTQEEIQNFLAAQTDLTDEVSWGVISRFVNGGEYAIKTVENRKVLTEKYGKKEVTAKLSAFLFSDVKMAIKERNENMLEQAMKGADEMLGEMAESYKARYRLYYYQMTEDWTGYAEIASEIAKNPELNNSSMLNQMAWTIYEKSNDQTSVQKALEWMKKVVADEPGYAYLDTYAALLYKNGQKEEALDHAARAIAAGEAEGVQTDDTMALLEKIKAL